jgi:molecular chaperone DnaK (HSP70)
MDIVVPRNTKIPVVDKYNIFETAYDFQEKALIKVYQGERVQVKDNDLLGKFQVEGVTKKKAGEVKFKINFNIDVNSLLTVTADEIIDYKEGDNNLKLKKSNKNLKVKEYRNKLSEDEIERRIEELNKLTDIQKEIDEAVRERVNLQMACQRLGLNNKLAKEYFNWSRKNPNQKKEVYRKKREEIEKLMNQ